MNIHANKEKSVTHRKVVNYVTSANSVLDKYKKYSYSSTRVFLFRRIREVFIQATRVTEDEQSSVDTSHLRIPMLLLPV